MNNRKKTRKGFAVPLAILAAVAVAFFVATLSTLNRGYKAGLQHLNTRQHMFNTAYSAYSTVLARLHEKAWNDRFFKGPPHTQNGVPFEGATYDLYVTDTPGKAYQADLYVRVKFLKASQVFFWRFLYVDDILDTSGRTYPLVFLDVEPQYFPGGGSSLDDMINDILAKRKLNRPKALEKAKLANTLNKINDVAMVLPALPAGSAVPESSVGTQDPATPEIPGVFVDSTERERLGGEMVSDPPSTPPQYTGPQEFGDSGSGVRVATRGGQCHVNARCVDESGCRVFISVNGRTVLSWKSNSKHSYRVLKGDWMKKAAEMDDLEKSKSLDKFTKDIKKGFNTNFTIKAGEKVVTSFVGKKTAPNTKTWFSLTGPF